MRMARSRRDPEFSEIESVLADAGDEESLTAREIFVVLKARGLEYKNVHQIATVLGRAAQAGHVDVTPSSPYRYRIRED